MPRVSAQWTRPWGAVLLPALLLSFLPLAPPRAEASQGHLAGFSIRFKEEVNPYAVLGVFVLPEESLAIEIAEADAVRGPYLLEAPGGRVEKVSDTAWEWRAPARPGHVAVRILQRPSGRTMTLNAFVMVPVASGAQQVRGYTLGSYPGKPLKGLPAYLPPRGFVEVTAANRNLPVSPHFTLGQFVCKQGDGLPKYLVLRERLLLKLEALLAAVNDEGYRVSTFTVMSGFRTPAYNRGLNNGAYSRHIYGDAADIFIDENRDGVMDDLNRNGKSDLGDAQVLRALIDALAQRPSFQAFTGGLGLYNATRHHGPYVHVDARGYVARWGAAGTATAR
jgi:hypothetical protein